MKIIVLYQSKKKMKLEEKAVVMMVLRVAELNPLCAVGRKHWFFSGAFSSGAAIRPLWCGCPGFSKNLKKPA